MAIGDSVGVNRRSRHSVGIKRFTGAVRQRYDKLHMASRSALRARAEDEFHLIVKVVGNQGARES